MTTTTWENVSEATRGANPEWPLTHLSDLGGRGLAVKATRTCSIDGCDRPVSARGWCGLHYQRWRKHGDPLADTRKQPSPCSHPDGCSRPSRSRGLCDRHYARLVRGGELGPVGALGTGPGPLSNAWKGDRIPYQAAHSRVRRLRGVPSLYPCRSCDRPAQDWAYDHQDPAEQRDDKNRPYSCDPAHYLPLCRRCHRRFDRGDESDAPGQ